MKDIAKLLMVVLCMASACPLFGATGFVNESKWAGGDGSYSEGYVVKANGLYWCCKDCGAGVMVMGFDYEDYYSDDYHYVPGVFTQTWTSYPDDSYRPSGAISIPATLGGKSVVKIGDYAFYECRNITSVSVPDTVSEIGREAFNGCSRMSSVALPTVVKTIGNRAFAGCSALASVQGLSEDVVFGSKAFEGCTKLYKNGMLIMGGNLLGTLTTISGTIVVPEGVHTICDSAFADSSDFEGDYYDYRAGITSVQLPGTLRRIGSYAFEHCTGMSAITIPNGVTNISDRAFCNCSGLKSISMPNTLKRIDSYAFERCVGLSTIAIPNGVTNISDHAFYYCSGLKSISMPSTVTAIGQYAFYGCASLPEIVLSENLKTMGEGSLSGCSSLKKVTMPPDVSDSDSYVVRDDEVHWTTRGNLKRWIGTSPVEELVFAGAGDKMACQMCKDVTTLKKFVFSEGVTRIEREAFNGCTALSSISLPVGLTAIEYGTFEGCVSLSEISIPKGVTRIESRAFFGCGNLAEMLIPASVTSIGDGAFCGCNKLADQNGFIIFNNFLHGYAGTESEVEIPEIITGIGLSAFQNCTNLKAITIPSDVLSIGYNAFAGCTQLTKVYVSAGDAERVKGLMANCGRSLALITFIEQTDFTVTFDLGEHGQRTGGGELSQKIVGGQAAIAPTVLASKDWQFDGWDKDFTCVNADMTVKAKYLWDFVIANGRLTKYRGPGGAITIPDGVTSIEDSVFAGLDTLISVTVPDSVTSIGEKAFYNCSSLSEFTLPESVTFIGAQAFDNSAFYLRAYRKMLMSGNAESGSGAGAQTISVTVTNVVVNYVLNSAQPQFALPSTYDTGFVNIIAEVKGGCVAVPATWTVNYPKFTEKFGSDFTKALAMRTGKKDGAGNDMFVWQDYVAGTDPTKEDDVFTASITIVDGEVKVSYTPELDAARKALRKYTTWGKKSLLDSGWTEVDPGKEADYNFFKVTVEMK